MIYEQGSTPIFYATFVDYQGRQAVVSSGTASIFHKHGSVDIWDISGTMTQMSESTFYYTWNIPANADEGFYSVKYVGAYDDGTVAVGGEGFQVIPRGFYDKKGGGFVQKISAKKDIWTKEEKELVLKLLEQLMAKKLNLTPILETLDEKMDENGSKFNIITREIVKYNQLKEDLNQILTAIEHSKSQDVTRADINNFIKQVQCIALRLDEFKELDKTGRIITELNDLRLNLDQLQRLVIKTLPDDALRRAELNGHI